VKAPTEIRVKVADYAVADAGTMLVTVGLGSCVAIALYDPQARVGGLAHVLLPSTGMSQDRTNRAKFPSTAVPLLCERMQALGARTGRMRAKIVGGASMFTSLLSATGLQIGERNVVATRAALEHAGIPIVGQEVGGEYGRSVYFDVCDGRVVVKSLRAGHVVL
jgi:chemotaxis protein CheD